MNCRVCGHIVDKPLFSSGRKTSLTSMCTVEQQETVVYLCRSCGHLQTPPLEDLAGYYDTEYRMSIDEPDEDQLYAMVDGKPVYRTAFQASTLVQKIDAPMHAKVLDFGAAKGMTARHLSTLRPDLSLHAFDVSDRYREHWLSFLPQDQTATYSVPEDWTGRFDIVMSFYVLEHVDDPKTYISQARQLLKDDGILYLVVPNTFTNLSDFVVVDHVNHFTDTSLRALLGNCGLAVKWLDDTTHTGAWIVAATVGRSETGEPAATSQTQTQAKALAARWTAIYESLDRMSTVATTRTTAIYGASFFGSLIATNLDRLDNVVQFLDQNPHLQGRMNFERPVTAPEELDDEVTDVLVGLDPLRARDIVTSVKALKNRPLNFHYLDGNA